MKLRKFRSLAAALPLAVVGLGLLAPAAAAVTPQCFSITPQPGVTYGLCVDVSNVSVTQPTTDDATITGSITVRIYCNPQFPAENCTGDLANQTVSFGRTGFDPDSPSIEVSLSEVTFIVPGACAVVICTGPFGATVAVVIVALHDVGTVWVNGMQVASIG